MAKNIAITEWMSPEDAADYIFNAIKTGEFLKGELKKSSYKFANGKDKSDGYMCKVLAINGAIRREPTNKNAAKAKIVDGIIVPEKKAVPAPELPNSWVEDIDKLDMFDLEDELVEREYILKKVKNPQKFLLLAKECDYIKARLIDHESVLDPEIVAYIHQYDRA